MSECAKRVLIRLPGVRDLWHVHKLHEREPGDLGRGCCIVPKTVRPGKVKAEIPACGGCRVTGIPTATKAPVKTGMK